MLGSSRSAHVMTKHIIFWSLEFALCFVFALNLYMRGRLTILIGAILGLLILSMVMAAIIVFGSSYALLSFVLMWVFIVVSKPFAGRLAFRILGFRAGVGVVNPPNLPSQRLHERQVYRRGHVQANCRGAGDGAGTDGVHCMSPRHCSTASRNEPAPKRTEKAPYSASHTHA